MKTMTIKKFIKTANEDYLFTPVSNGAPADIVEGVSTTDFQHNLDLYMKHNLGQFDIDEEIAEDNDTIAELKADIREICGLLYFEKKYEYETLYNTTDLYYNPIENYDRTEEETYTGTIEEDNTHTVGAQSNTRTQGAQSNTHSQGAQSNSTTFGEVSEENVIGSHSDTNAYGETVVTHVNGATQKTTQNPQVQTTVENGARSHTENEAHTTGVSAFDGAGTITPVGNSGTGSTGNANFNNKERVIDEKTVADAAVTDTTTVAAHDIVEAEIAVTNTDTTGEHSDTITVGEHTDTHTEEQRTDSQSFGARSDSDTIGQREDSESLGQRQDTDDNSHTNEWERELKVHGNIGTVTTQDMIKQEREIAMFNLLKIVAKDIANRIAICVYK